jgi:translation initiation factor IF-1
LPKDDCLQFEGIVLSARGNGNFLVKIDDSNSDPISCVLSGKIRKNTIRILEGDRVKIEVSPYDLSRGRICYRSKANTEQQ